MSWNFLSTELFIQKQNVNKIKKCVKAQNIFFTRWAQGRRLFIYSHGFFHKHLFGYTLLHSTAEVGGGSNLLNYLGSIQHIVMVDVYGQVSSQSGFLRLSVFFDVLVYGVGIVGRIFSGSRDARCSVFETKEGSCWHQGSKCDDISQGTGVLLCQIIKGLPVGSMEERAFLPQRCWVYTRNFFWKRLNNPCFQH